MSGGLASLPHKVPNVGSADDLRRCLRDLIAISSLPTLWIEADERRIATDLADTLIGLLHLDFAGVTLSPEGKPRTEVRRTRRVGGRRRGAALFDRLVELEPGFHEIADPTGEERYRILCIALGGREAVLRVGSRRPDFPTEPERILLRAAANNAALAVRLNRKVERARTDRQHMQEQQDLLLVEISHRVKNTLAIVQSISAQTLRHAASPQDFHASFEARLAALSYAHSLLIETNWEGMSFRALLERVLAACGAEYPKRCTLTGDDILIGANDAVSTIMLFHELANNAVKYGALSGAAGQVSIEWRRLEAPRRLAVRWEETGGPTVHVPNRRGFGSLLIERGVTPGSSCFDFRPEGLVCTFELPLHTDRGLARAPLLRDDHRARA